MKPVFFILIALSSLASALESDRDLPIEIIQADRSEWDNKANETRYFGDVIVVQGELRIESQTLVVKTELINGQQELSKITATGSPAYYRDLIKLDEAPMELWGETLEYIITPEQITATGNAKIKKGCNRQESPRIQYDGTNERLITDKVTGSVLPGLADGTNCN